MIPNLEYQFIIVVTYDRHRLPTPAGPRHIKTGTLVWDTDSRSSWCNRCTIFGGAVIAIRSAHLRPGRGIMHPQLKLTDSGVVRSSFVQVLLSVNRMFVPCMRI